MLRVPDLRDDSGSAIAGFVLAGGLISVLFAAVVQVGFGLYVRTVVIDAAAEGARLGARADMTLADAEARTAQLITANVSADYAANISAFVDSSSGAEVIEVTVVTPLPVIALVGPSDAITLRGHALREVTP